MSASADSFLQRLWYERHAPWLSGLLLPLSCLFRVVVSIRRRAYSAGLLRQIRVARPVVIVGNITVGGTGKTPFTIWLAQQLQSRGHRVGIILRGYGGRSAQWPRDVQPDSDWQEVGDEAVLLARRTGAIVVAGPDRVAAARRAIERGAQIVLSDDGLQHYRLARNRELVVIDGARGFGNGRLLPAGPLREPFGRLAEADLRIIMQRDGVSRLDANGAVVARPRLLDAINLVTNEARALTSFSGAPVHALAGIGHPAAFFDQLRALGLAVEDHPMPDHARLTADDIRFADDAPVLMTEKDAVKCRAIADRRHWAVRMDVTMSSQDTVRVLAAVDSLVDAER